MRGIFNHQKHQDTKEIFFMKNTKYKWIATKGERYQTTVGFGFFTKAQANDFAQRANRLHNSGYFVAKVFEVKNPKFL